MWIAAIILCCVLAIMVYWSYRHRKLVQQLDSMPMNQQMSDLAVFCATVAREQHQVELDFSASSIEQADRFLHVLHESFASGAIDQGEVHRWALRCGAYVGEVIRRERSGFEWARDSAVAGASSFPLKAGEDEVYPMAWCFKRITNGPEDSIVYKWKILLDSLDKQRPT